MFRTLGIIAVPVALFVMLSAFDIAREAQPFDVVEIGLDIAEQAILVLMVVAIIWSIQRISRLQEDQQALQDLFARQSAKADGWRATRSEEIGAMRAAIEDEFNSWSLTPAERDVANLLLKGASMKQIAFARDTSEATIRQQARSMYQKAGLSGRAELSAYFLDGLFDDPPMDQKSRLRVVDR